MQRPLCQRYRGYSLENGNGHNGIWSRNASASMASLLFKLSLALLVVLAASISLYWMVSISASSRVNIYRGYRRLQEKLVVDLSQIKELSVGSIELCPPEYENYVPCYYNVSGRLDEYERDCVHEVGKRSCLIGTPQNYRIPLRWPTGRDFIWKKNVKIAGEEFSSGTLTKRMMVEEQHISFHYDSLMVDGVEDYAHQIADMIGLGDESDFNDAGIRNILDIGCGFGSFGAHLFSKHLLTMCIANYEVSGSQVQLTLERGLPAIIASFAYKQLPFPYLSFDMLHCARCGIDWEAKDGALLVEMDRVLRPGGYFVWTSPLITVQSLRIKENQKKWTSLQEFTKKLCWELLSQQDQTVLWKKTRSKNCYNMGRNLGLEICSKRKDVESPYYQPLQSCISGTRSLRWIPIETRTPWPSRETLNSSELRVYDLHEHALLEDAIYWKSVVPNYWSLLSPLIFSDHPKRPGDEDPEPPFNMLRNVMDMNAHFGGFNAALRECGKDIWVINVVPTTSANYLPLILDRGLIGVQHDWCEAFPTYPRTYDLIHVEGLLSLEKYPKGRCTMFGLFLEIDRILRPEGWVIIKDKVSLIESARQMTNLLKWDARMMEVDITSEDKILICQKPFLKKL